MNERSPRNFFSMFAQCFATTRNAHVFVSFELLRQCIISVFSLFRERKKGWFAFSCPFHFIRIINVIVSRWYLLRNCNLAWEIDRKTGKKKIIVRFFPPLGVNIDARSESVSINWSSKRANLNVLSDSCIGKMSVPPIDNRFVSYLTRESRDADGPLSLWKFLGGGGVCVANSPDRWFRNSSGGYVSLVVILIFEWIHQLSLTVLLFFYSWILLSNKRRNLRRKRRILITKPSVHYYHYYYQTLVRSKVVNFFFKSVYIFSKNRLTLLDGSNGSK